MIAHLGAGRTGKIRERRRGRRCRTWPPRWPAERPCPGQQQKKNWQIPDSWSEDVSSWLLLKRKRTDIADVGSHIIAPTKLLSTPLYILTK